MIYNIAKIIQKVETSNEILGFFGIIFVRVLNQNLDS
jgi:hypothetical protein